MVTEGIGITEQKLATLRTVRGHDVIVMKLVHCEFRQLQNCKTNIHWLVERDAQRIRLDHDQIFVNDLTRLVAGFAHGLDCLISLGNEA